MSDADLQTLLRTAESKGDGPSWLRAAQALARTGRLEEAGRAAHRAGARGEDPTAVLESLVPETLALERRELGERFEIGKLGHAAWSADARTLYAVENKSAVLAWDAVRGGRPRRLAALNGDASALACGLEGDLAVAWVALDREKMKQVPSVACIDASSGELGEAIGRGHQFIRSVALTTPGLVHCAETKRARAYRREGDAWPEKTLWSVNGEAVSLGTWGTAVVLAKGEKGGELRLHDSLAKEPRATVALDVPVGAPGFHLEAAGRRAVLVFEDIVLVEGDGKPIARAPLPAGTRVYDVLPSPSGRWVALFFAQGGERSTRLDVIDLYTDKSQTFDLGARPRRAAWSPSGRRLAVPTDQGTIVVLEAPGEALTPAEGGLAKKQEALPERKTDSDIAKVLFGEPRSTDAAVIDALWGDAPKAPPAAPRAKPVKESVPEGTWIELRSADRFWRARRTGSLIEFRHGGLGTQGTVGATPFPDDETAKRELERRIREKERGGYRRVE